ncbi:MAG TPA: mechanosensitive ion channel family protein [Burkholderiales bacterium]|nr:mechanosensitive ion channel family protein [Burkholderiales bacterium]
MQWQTIFDFFGSAELGIAATALCAAFAALIIQIVLTMIIRRLISRHPYMQALLKRSVGPFRLLFPMIAIQAVLAAAPRQYEWLPATRHAVLLAMILAITWLATAAVMGIRDVMKLRFPIDVGDNLHARRVLTQTTVLLRTLSGVVILLGVAAALTTFPGVRQIGASLLASAGLAGIVVGFAARPVLGNLIAGLQIAMAQPIRIDDVVIVQNEWGVIEEIAGAYVVVKIWDERRLVVPLQWFIENPFQNWTRTGSQIIGTVFLWVDYSLPLEPLRAEMMRICESAKEWDRRVASLQVTETSEQAMQLRIIASSNNASLSWDLRCRIREGLIAFIQREYPAALPRMRAQLVEQQQPHQEKAMAQGASDQRATAAGKATPEPANA